MRSQVPQRRHLRSGSAGQQFGILVIAIVAVAGAAIPLANSIADALLFAGECILSQPGECRTGAAGESVQHKLYIPDRYR